MSYLNLSEEEVYEKLNEKWLDFHWRNFSTEKKDVEGYKKELIAKIELAKNFFEEQAYDFLLDDYKLKLFPFNNIHCINQQRAIDLTKTWLEVCGEALFCEAMLDKNKRLENLSLWIKDGQEVKDFYKYSINILKKNNIKKELPELYSCLFRALNSGDKELVKDLLSLGISPNGGSKKERTTDLPLWWCFLDFKNNKEVAELLIENGADVNAIKGSQSLLHSAVSSNNKDVVEFLLKHGADIYNNWECEGKKHSTLEVLESWVLDERVNKHSNREKIFLMLKEKQLELESKGSKKENKLK